MIRLWNITIDKIIHTIVREKHNKITLILAYCSPLITNNI